MKQFIFFLLLLLPAAAAAQHSASYVYYAIDSVTVDSFFLKTVTITGLGSPRQDTSYSYQLFTDTTAFISFVEGRHEELLSFGDRYLFLKEERDTLSNRYDRLVALGGSAESPFRSVQLPPELRQKKEQATNPGFWLVPTASPGEAVWMTEATMPQADAVLLYPDGRKIKVEAPKPRPKPKPKKGKQ